MAFIFFHIAKQRLFSIPERDIWPHFLRITSIFFVSKRRKENKKRPKSLTPAVNSKLTIPGSVVKQKFSLFKSYESYSLYPKCTSTVSRIELIVRTRTRMSYLRPQSFTPGQKVGREGRFSSRITIWCVLLRLVWLHLTMMLEGEEKFWYLEERRPMGATHMGCLDENISNF